jgi:F-type H+-transporting ATPase subunit alpha
MANTQFDKLVASGKQVGEVIGVEKFLVRVRGLQPINTHAVVLFEDGSKGYVHHVYEDFVVVLHLGAKTVTVGMVVVMQHDKLVARVGKNYVGRVISVLGEPLDGKGPIEPDGTWPIFHDAPMLFERELLDTPLETGIITLDIMYSLARGQRMTLLGDGKSGKSSLATQIAINQRSTDITTVYVLIGKRRADLIELIDRLEVNGAMEKTIVIAATMFESLVLNYLAPYVAAAMGEYLWQHLGQDTLVIYDDLTSHAMAYREISLLAGVSPGRDSYPGDMFYTHSSLVERAGKLNRNHATQTILPIVYAPGGDITAYLPTNVMSMTDGQWILDMEVFREVMRPAISTGLSVTRVGGAGHNKRQKALAVQTSKALAAYKQAEEYAHFGSELSDESAADLERGKNLYKLFNQVVGETYNFMEQQLLLDIIVNMAPGESFDMEALKQNVKEFSQQVGEDDDGTDESKTYKAARDALKAKCLVQKVTEEKPAEEKKDTEAEGDKKQKPDDNDKQDGKKDKKDKNEKEHPKEQKKEEHKKKFGFPHKKKPETEDHNHKDTHTPGTVLEPEEGVIVPETKVDADIEDPNKALTAKQKEAQEKAKAAEEEAKAKEEQKT